MTEFLWMQKIGEGKRSHTDNTYPVDIAHFIQVLHYALVSSSPSFFIPNIFKCTGNFVTETNLQSFFHIPNLLLKIRYQTDQNIITY